MSLFSDLYRPTRSMIGDIGPIPMFSNDMLDYAISNAILDEGDAFDEGDLASGGFRTIVPDVTSKDDIRIISLRAAIALFVPSYGKSSYKTRALSVNQDLSKFIGYLRERLRLLTDGGRTPISDTEWDLLMRGPSQTLGNLSGISSSWSLQNSSGFNIDNNRP